MNKLLSCSERIGCREADAFNGKTTLMFDNVPTGKAQDLLRTAVQLPAHDSFSIRFWMKAAIGYWCFKSEMLEPENFQDRASMTRLQAELGGVVCANVPFDTTRRVGFSIARLQPRAYLTATLTLSDNDTFQFTGMRDCIDDRWHMITFTVDRQGDFCAWIDDRLFGAQRIAAVNEAALTGEPLVIGADTRGENGVGGLTMTDFEVSDTVLSPVQIKNLYYAGATQALKQEILNRHLQDAGLWDTNRVQRLHRHADELAEMVSDCECAENAYRLLKEEYEQLLLNPSKQPDLKLYFESDTHCEGDNGPRCLTVRRGMQFAASLGVDAIVDGGDYSYMGEQQERDSFWHAIEEEWSGKPLFVTLGNHETLVMPAQELLKEHCNHLKKQGMIPEDWQHYYYDGEINGYHLIVMGQYSEHYTISGKKGLWFYAGDMQPEQLNFIEEKLNAFCGQGKPVFIVVHPGVEEYLKRVRHGIWDEKNSLVGCDKLYKMLAAHPDAVLCSGHVHHGFGVCGLSKQPEGYHILDLPGIRGTSFGYGIYEKDLPGHHHGVYFAFLFGSTILLRARDIGTGEWLTAYDQLFTL